jgi:hypothetical protein
MKKIFLFFALVSIAVALTYCNSSKKAAAAIPKLSYDNNIHAMVTTKCTPCHVPSKGGNKLPLDTYDAAKNHIDEIISRIELHPGDKGYMPFKKPRLSDSAINVFKQWKADGLLK